jgi:hypothetical protein
MLRAYDDRVLTGTIRPTDTVTFEVEGDSLDEIAQKLADQTPDGYELTDRPVVMKSGSSALTAKGTFKHRAGTREIEADDMPALRAKVPDGYQLIRVWAS